MPMPAAACAITVAQAAPSMPIPNPKMKIGSSMRFVPKPTTRDIIDLTAPPSARVNAESPNARWEKICEKTTILR